MQKDADISLTCRQCGKSFLFTVAEQEFFKEKGFTFPHRCKECRSTQQNHSQRLVCSQCGAEFDGETAVYCSSCLANVELEFELKTKKTQKATNEAYARLKAIESERAGLEESLCHKEQLLEEFEKTVNDLSHELEEARQLYATLNRWFQPTLNGLEERVVKRLEALEQGQNKINERMLQLVGKIFEMYDNTTLIELIKRSLRPHQKPSTQPT